MLTGAAITDPRGTRVLNEDSVSALRATWSERDHMYHWNLPGPLEALLDWLSLKDRRV